MSTQIPPVLDGPPSAVANNRCPRPGCGGELQYLSTGLTHTSYVCWSCGHGVTISLAPEITPTNLPVLDGRPRAK